jgi:hypothetical protein
MDKIALFVDETQRLVKQEIPEYDCTWLTTERLKALPTTFAHSLIGTFVRVNAAQECTPTMFQKNLEILKDLLSLVEQNNWSALLDLKLDPRLYMSEEELAERLADRLFEKLDKPASLVQSEMPDVSQLTTLLSQLQGTAPKKKPKRKVK